MIKRWKEVRVFISSTFKDFHAERDLLVRDVFPKLKERLRKYRVHLVDIDLRWGVSEEDARSGNALDICLDEIDGCRPYFLGLLGHRYGWKPDGEDHSITASEIYHGVLKNDIPAQIVELRSILEDKFENVQLSDEQKNCLSYNYKWDGKKGKYLLRNNVERADLEMIRSIFAGFSAYQRDRSFFFFRSEELSRELAEGKNIDDFFDSDPQEKEQLDNLKQEIEDNCQPPVEYFDLEEFGVKIEEILWKRMELEFADADAEEKDELEIEADFHELFIADRTRHFVGREELLGEMLDFVDEADGQQILAISGKPGVGKSALLGQFTGELLETRTDYFIIPHFVGASPSSTGVRNNLIYWSKKIARELGEEIEIPSDLNELKQLFESLLEKISKRKRTIFVIDAVNQLEKDDYAQMLRWLPWQMPENVKFIISTLPGKPLEALKNRGESVRFAELTGLTADERKRFVERYLKAISHEFPHDDAQVAFFEKIEHGHPLYIQVALEELRLFGEYEEVMNRILLLPETIEELFEQVLQRIEESYGKELVQAAMCLIACGRQGMTAPELKDLLKQYAPKDTDGNEMPRLPDMILSRLYRSFSGYLFEREGLIDFFHGQLKTAVGNRYLEEKQDRDNYHRVIADYFETRWQEPYTRALDELPHQRIKSEDWDGLVRVLCDLIFIQEKAIALNVYGIFEDYSASLVFMPQTGKKEILRDFENVFRQEMHNLKDHPDLTFQQMYNQLQWYGRDVKNLIEQAKNEYLLKRGVFLHQYKKPRLVESNLIRRMRGHKGFVYCCAISKNKDIFISGGDESIKIWCANSGKEISKLAGHTNRVTSCLFADSEDLLISTSFDSSVRIWDIGRSEEKKILLGHKGKVNCSALSPDGGTLLTGGDDNALIFWDIFTGKEISRIEDQTNEIKGCDFSPDGNLVISCGQKKISVWDRESGKELATLNGHIDNVLTCKFSPDGKYIVSGGYDAMRFWDSKSFVAKKNMAGRGRDICDLQFSECSNMILSASLSGVLQLWDINTGEVINEYEGHFEGVLTCAISSDNELLLSGSYDKTLVSWKRTTKKIFYSNRNSDQYLMDCDISSDASRIAYLQEPGFLTLWDGKTGDEREEHFFHMNKGVTTCSFSPDNKKILTPNRDCSLALWDIDTGSITASIEGHDLWLLDRNYHITGYKELNRVSACSFSGSGEKLVTASDDKTLKVWNSRSGDMLATLRGHKNIVNSCAFSSDETKVISGSFDRTIKIWDILTSSIVQTINCPFIPEVVSIIFIDSKEIIVSGYSNGFQTLWDIDTFSEIAYITGQEKTFEDCAFSQNGRISIWCDDAQTLICRDIITGRIICRFKADYDLTCCSISKCGTIIACGGKSGNFYILRLVS